MGLYLLAGENSTPVAENLNMSTYKNVAITGQFAAVDPEGDLLTFQLVEKPARGSITMPEDGGNTFVYTPYENKTGKDSFTYVAVDTAGNASDPATVKIKIEKAKTTISYVDMTGDPAQKAAIRMAEEGILVGECMGGSYFFRPEEPVSRGEFVAMAMQAVGMSTLEGVERTGFADDLEIPTWAKPYASSALKAGLVQGAVTSDGQVVFRSTDAITRAEAARSDGSRPSGNGRGDDRAVCGQRRRPRLGPAVGGESEQLRRPARGQHRCTGSGKYPYSRRCGRAALRSPGSAGDPRGQRMVPLVREVKNRPEANCFRPVFVSGADRFSFGKPAAA